MKQHTGKAFGSTGFWGHGNTAYMGQGLNKVTRFSGGSTPRAHGSSKRGWCSSPPSQFDVARTIVTHHPMIDGESKVQNIGIDKWMSLRDIVSRFPFAKTVKYVFHDGTFKMMFRK